ncbi:hypothetical protein GF420_09105 [candidate division GN15 bacterium]|nr:hypothetical protein [candidate division GN15 bacterium]
MESTNAATEPQAPAPAPSGLSLRGLWEVFFKPADFFAEIKDHPRLIVPWLMVAVATAATIYLMDDFIIKMQMDAMRDNPNMNPSMMPTADQMRPWLYIGVLFWAVLPIVTAAIALFWGNFVFGGAAKFSQLLSVMLYGLWLYMIGGVIQAFMALAKGSMKASLSLAVLVPDRPIDDPLYTLLSKLSVFHVWEIIVVGIGLSVLYKFPRNKGYLIAVLSVGLVALIHVASAAIF